MKNDILALAKKKGAYSTLCSAEGQTFHSLIQLKPVKFDDINADYAAIGSDQAIFSAITVFISSTACLSEMKALPNFSSKISLISP